MIEAERYDNSGNDGTAGSFVPDNGNDPGGSGGGSLSFTAPDPLVAGTEIKALHLTELRDAANQVRAHAGLSAASWQEPVTAGWLIKAEHVSELRTKLDEALAALGLPTGGYSAGVGVGNEIRAVHFQELRDRTRAALGGGAATNDFLVYNYPQVLPITGNEEQSYVPTAGGQWMNYTVNVASTGSYTFEARVASPYGGNTFHVEVDGVDRTGAIYIPNTGSGDVYQFVTVNDISLDAGQRVIRVVIDGTGQSKGNFDYFTINPYFPPQFCNPESGEIQDCQNSGGSWDYGLCGCQY